MTAMRVPIAAAICTYERHETMSEAILSLGEQTLGDDRFRVLVVDNSPPSARREKAKGDFDGQGNLRYLTVDTPGLSNARNIAADAAGADVVAYLDDDAIAQPRWLEEVLVAFDTFGDEAGIVGGRVDPIWTIERPAWLSDSMLGALTVVDHGGVLREKSSDEWIAGANFSVRSEPLLETGGFSTALGRKGPGQVLLSNEDSAIVERFEKMGLKTIWAPDAIVGHRVDPERVSTEWFRRRMAWQAVSDFVADPDATLEYVERQWDHLLTFINRLPPRLRTPRGLFEELDDDALTEAQIGAAYSVTVLMLAGFDVPSRT